jgi:branched-chain amino acid transport system permease protein
MRTTGLPLLARHLGYGGVGLAGIVLLSLVIDPYRNLQLAEVAVLVCAAAGLSVLTGLSGQISLGQGAFMAVGAYTAALLLAEPGRSLPLVLLAATLVSAVVGVLVGAAAARLRGPYLAGATLAFAVGLPALVDYRGLASTLGGQNGLVVLSPGPPAGWGDVPLDRWQLWVCGAGAVLVLVLLANLTRSRVGRSWQAVRDDEVAAQLAGLAVARLQIGAFVVSAACAGLGGGLLAFSTGLAAPGAFGLTLSLQLLAAVVLGGLGTLTGAVYGSLLLVFLPAVSADLAGRLDLSRDVYANLPLLVYGLVLVVVMLTFPAGVQGGLVRAAQRFRRTG